MEPKECPALAAGVRLQTDKVTGEPVLLFPEGLLQLNPAAHAIVRRCDGRTTLDGILAAVAAEYEVEASTLRDDVVDCLRQLRERKLVVFLK